MPRATSDRPRRRRPWLRIAAWLLLGALVLDKAVSLASPRPTVGHWRSAEGRDAYRRAYQAVMSDLPEPTRSQDVATRFGSVRALTWQGTVQGAPIVLLPGHSSGAPMWAENLPSWIGTRTVIALDPIGDAGFSTQSTPLRSFEDQAEWISETLVALRIPRAHTVGHSFGGANAAIHAVRHPDQVASLTLLEPVQVIRRLPVSMFCWATLTQLPVPQRLKDRALAEIGGTTVEEVRRRSPMSVMIDAASAQYSTALPLPRVLTDAEWRRLTMPVRIDIAGTSSLTGGQQAADRMRTVLPGARTTLWPQATHSLPMQQKAELGPLLLDFWAAAD